jgi:subtilisin-like proprotein convertase family protein
VILAALAGGTLADAQSQGSADEARPHLLVVPSTPEGEAALARSDARVVAGYEAFSLVEAAGVDDERLRRAGADRRDDMRTVRTAAGAIDPKSARRSLAGKQAPDRDEVLAVVQFVGPPKDAWLDRVRSTGARIVVYQAENAYVVHAAGEEVDRLAALVSSYPPVRAVAALSAADKLDGSRSPSGRYAVQTVTGAEGEQARDEASGAGAGVSRPVAVGALHTQYLELTEAEAAELARDPAVVAIEPYGQPELADERGAQIVAGNLTGFGPSGPSYLTWLLDPLRIPTPATFDFAIDVTDEGFDGGTNPPTHSDFLTQGSGVSRLAYLNNYSTDANTRDCGGHGTNVGSIAAGYNDDIGNPVVEDSSGYNHGLGVAPFARVGVSKIFNCAGAFGPAWTPAGLASAAYGGSARVSNNSWGSGGVTSWSDYSARAREYDAVVRDARASVPGNQGLVEVFAAGNDGNDNPGPSNEGYGTILAEGTAKNVITVGSAEGVRPSGTDGCGVPDASADSARDIVDFSSRGPTDDGRLKPDLVAPGSHTVGARPRHGGYTGGRTCVPFFGGASAFYSLISGSSQAAPQVSGAAALVRHWYTRTEGTEPSPALTKALLINTATDLGGGQNGKGDTVAAGPNLDQGWGRVNLGNAFDATARQYHDQLPADLLANSGSSSLRTYSVASAGAPVKVTLAWTDAPGPITGNSFVNDLNLEVQAGGSTYKGNVFGDAFSRAGGAADTRNNVESVYLPAGTAGPIAVKVVGANIAGDGVPGNGDSTDQDFALVVSNANEQASPVLVHDATTVDDSGAGDADGALEPGEPFTLDERLLNAGNAAATTVNGTLSAGLNLTVNQGSSSWPNLAAGTSATNVTPFAATIPGGTTCGVDATATIALTSDQGPQTVPLVLPTGVDGAPVPRTLTPGSAIPDDSALGLASTINIPDAGVVKDLDVRVNITHSWVGDLRLDLTGPDGTTVKLAEHPGGPDNGGQNFVNMVFDDEAPTSISTAAAPYTGRFRPQNDQLERFNGKPQTGDWTLRVRDLFEGDTGSLGSWGTDTHPAECLFDPSPPQTTINSGPAQGATVGTSSATFGFSGGTTFECELDGGGFSACSSPRLYTGLSNGTHTFRVRAVNGALKDPTPATRTWTVDTVAPQTTITSGPAEGQRVNSGSALFQFVSPDTPGATFQCSLDGAPFSVCTEPHAVSGLPEGPHNFRVQALDAVANVDATPATRNWIVDLTPPSPTVTGPVGGTVDSQPTLTGTGGIGPGDLATVTVRIYAGHGLTDPPGGPALRTVSVALSPSGLWAVELPAPLALGPYTAQVEQADSAGNSDRSPLREFSVVPDFVAPVVRLTTPPNGSTTADTTPTLAGVAGTTPGDDGTVSVKLWKGTLASGVPSQTLVVPRDGASGAFSATPAPLAEGTYTARAVQGDSGLPAENFGMSAPTTFTVDVPGPAPAPVAPSFALAPIRERLSEAIAGRYTVLAACDSACRVSAKLGLSARGARKLGMGARPVAIGSGAKRLSRAGAAAVDVGLTRAARNALRGRKGAKAGLDLTVREADGTELTLERTVSLRSSAGLDRIVRRGMGLWGICSKSCTLRGALRVSAAKARKLGLEPNSRSRVTIASGRSSAGRSPKKLILEIASSARGELLRADRVRALLEATAASAGTGQRRASRRLTLR